MHESLILERLQRIVYALPDRADQLVVMDWIDQAITSTDPMTCGLLELMLNEQAEIVVKDGEPRFRITQAGNDAALELLSTKPELRAMLEKLSGRAVIEPPKKPQ